MEAACEGGDLVIKLSIGAHQYLLFPMLTTLPTQYDLSFPLLYRGRDLKEACALNESTLTTDGLGVINHFGLGLAGKTVSITFLRHMCVITICTYTRFT